MDRASILADAIEYLKELLQRIINLQNELESITPQSLLQPTPTSFQPLTPTIPNLPCRVREEICAGSLPSPDSQPARVSLIPAVIQYFFWLYESVSDEFGWAAVDIFEFFVILNHGVLHCLGKLRRVLHCLPEIFCLNVFFKPLLRHFYWYPFSLFG